MWPVGCVTLDRKLTAIQRTPPNVLQHSPPHRREMLETCLVNTELKRKLEIIEHATGF